MSMEMRPAMEIELAVQQAQDQIAELREDLGEISKFIKGNGDPTKGLLWLAADLGRLVGAQAELLVAHRAELERHKSEGHYQRQPWYTRLGYDVAKSVAVWAVLGFLALAVLGARVSIAPPVLQ